MRLEKYIGVFVFTVFFLTACEDPIPNYHKSSINGQLQEFRSLPTKEYLGRSKIAWSLANESYGGGPGYLSETEKQKWRSEFMTINSLWKKANPNSPYNGPYEKYLLNEINKTRVVFNDYSKIKENYSLLYRVTGNKKYIAPTSEYTALSEFARKTKKICREVVNTYSGSVIAGAIQKTYSELSTMTTTVAKGLGEKAVKGYGECLCVMHDYFEVRDNFSIGFCLEKEYFECKDVAYCGEKSDRKKLAAELGNYRYKVKSIDLPGSYSSPGESASELLEWGKRQTEILVQQYCASDPNCY